MDFAAAGRLAIVSFRSALCSDRAPLGSIDLELEPRHLLELIFLVWSHVRTLHLSPDVGRDRPALRAHA
jgi:hypothetical protein